MDKVAKFLKQLSKKNRAILLAIFKDIQVLCLKKYDVKALKGYPGFFRLRKRNIRVVFYKQKEKGIIFDVARRKDIYKNL